MFNVTIDQIKCFQAVIEEGSFTRASERLNRAKSAVRYAVNNLEEQLGFTLLDRDHYRPKPTRQGKAFLLRSQPIIQEFHSLESYTKQIASEVETKLSLSVSDIYEMTKLYPIIKSAMKLFPTTEIKLDREILSGEKLLKREIVDIAVYESFEHDPLIEYKKIDVTELILVIGKGHPFIDLDTREMVIENLQYYPQIFQRSTIPDDESHMGAVENTLQWKVTDTASKKDFIKNGLGWGRLPRRMIKKELESGEVVHLKKLNMDDLVEVYMCRRKDSHMGKVAQFIWESF